MRSNQPFLFSASRRSNIYQNNVTMTSDAKVDSKPTEPLFDLLIIYITPREI